MTDYKHRPRTLDDAVERLGDHAVMLFVLVVLVLLATGVIS